MHKRKETPSYVAGMGPRSNMTFITSACMCVNFNSKDIRIQSARLQTKYRKLVTLKNIQKSIVLDNIL